MRDELVTEVQRSKRLTISTGGNLAAVPAGRASQRKRRDQEQNGSVYGIYAANAVAHRPKLLRGNLQCLKARAVSLVQLPTYFWWHFIGEETGVVQHMHDRNSSNFDWLWGQAVAASDWDKFRGWGKSTAN